MREEIMSNNSIPQNIEDAMVSGKKEELPEQKEIIRGIFNFSAYKNEDSGYCIFKYEGNKEYRNVYHVKYFNLKGHDLPQGKIPYEFVVEQDKDSKYPGRSFRCLSYKELETGDKEDAINWLSSEIFDGIGSKTAKKIVEKLGDSTIDAVKNDLNILKTVGIKGKAFEKVERSFKKHYANCDAGREELLRRKFGMSELECMEIRQIFSDIKAEEFEDYIKRHPYLLYTKGKQEFKIVDEFALEQGVAADSEIRICIGISEALRMNEAEGHTYISREDLVLKVKKMLFRIPFADDIGEKIEFLIEDNFCFPSFQVDESRIAKEETLMMENGLAHIFMSDNTAPIRNLEPYKGWTDEEYVSYLDEVIDRNTPKGIVLDPSQRNAIKVALNHQTSFITGGPGTGKTFVSNILIACYKDMTGGKAKKAELLAPTGVAAKRLSEKSGHTAKTFHSRFLIGNDTSKEDILRKSFEKEEREKVDPKYLLDNSDLEIRNTILIIDEASMADMPIIYRMFDYVDLETVHVVFVGDKDQLLPVGAGCVFKDVLEFYYKNRSKTGKNPVAYLSMVHRQGKGSGIIKAAEKIKGGYYMEALKSNDEYEVFGVEKSRMADDEYLKKLEDRIVEIAEKEKIKYSLNETMVLCPQNMGICGVHSINKRLQNVFNPRKESSLTMHGSYGYEYRVGDRVMHLKNNGVIVNGDVGYVKSIEMKSGKTKMIVTYMTSEGSVEYKYTKGNLAEICLCYAQTVHKSQGSEYDSVILCLNSVQRSGWKRALFYTGVTRGKKHVCVVSDREGIQRACGGTLASKRRTNLCKFMEWLLK